MPEPEDGPNGEWRSDPFGRYELRRFLYGRPTSLVKRGDIVGYDHIDAWLSAAGHPLAEAAVQPPPLPPEAPKTTPSDDALPPFIRDASPPPARPVSPGDVTLPPPATVLPPPPTMVLPPPSAPPVSPGDVTLPPPATVPPPPTMVLPPPPAPPVSPGDVTLAAPGDGPSAPDDGPPAPVGSTCVPGRRDIAAPGDGPSAPDDGPPAPAGSTCVPGRRDIADQVADCAPWLGPVHRGRRRRDPDRCSAGLGLGTLLDSPPRLPAHFHGGEP